MLNEALNIVEALEFEEQGEVVMLRSSSTMANGPW
jgi:hypothetical protein